MTLVADATNRPYSAEDPPASMVISVVAVVGRNTRLPPKRANVVSTPSMNTPLSAKWPPLTFGRVPWMSPFSGSLDTPGSMLTTP